MAETRASSAPGAREILVSGAPTTSVRDAARVLGCHPETVYAMARRGELAALGIRVLRLGKSMRIPTADLRRVVGESEDLGGDAA